MNSNSRGTIFNYGFALLALLVQPTLLTAIQQVVYDHHVNWLVGIICLAAIMADTYAILMLSPKVKFGLAGFWVWLAHMLLTTVTLVVAGSAFAGGQPEGNLTVPTILLVVVNVFKELWVLSIISVQSKPLSQSRWIGDVALLFAAGIQYVTFLGLVFSAGGNNNFSHGPAIIVDLIGLFILFGFGFFPLRLPYTLKEVAAFEQSWNIGYIVSVLVAFISTIYPSFI